VLSQCFDPGKGVRVVAVDERAIDVEDDGSVG
jgi:hypothetical protein